MEFDKSKVYTALNADELKIGSKVILANTLEDLKLRVSLNSKAETLYDIDSEHSQLRFVDVDGTEFALAYLVEEPEELKWTDLKIGDVVTNGKITAMVTAIVSSVFTSSHTYAGSKWLCDDELKEWEKVE